MFLKVLSFDIEVLPLGEQMPVPEKCPIVMMSFSANYEIIKDKKKAVFILDRSGKEEREDRGDYVLARFATEQRMIEVWENILKRSDCIVTYNGNGFDFPYIIDRCRVLGFNIKAGMADDGLWHKDRISKGMKVVTVGGMKGRIIFDVLYMLRRGDSSNVFLHEYNLKNLTLEWVSGEILGEEKGKLKFSARDMLVWWDTGAREEDFIAYGLRDAEVVLEMVVKFRLLDRFIMLSRKSGKLVQDVIDSTGFGGLVENLLMKAYKREDRVMPCRRKIVRNEGLGLGLGVDSDLELEGAYVHEPKLGITDYIGSCDYRSLYPSIHIKYNLCYSTVIMGGTEGIKYEEITSEYGVPYGKFVKKEVYVGIIPKILKNLMIERSRLKEEMKKYEKGTPEYISFDAGQNAAKILLNSFYGYTGDKDSKIYSWNVSSSVTGIGRKRITGTIDEINKSMVILNGKEYKMKVVIADSVTGDMPVLFFEKSIDGSMLVNILPISELYDYYTRKGDYNTLDRYIYEKEIYVESKSGLALLKNVYRHKVTKKGYKVVTRCGITKVTEDHSLFRYGREIKPTDLSVGIDIDTVDMFSLYKYGNIVSSNVSKSRGLKKENSDLAWVLGFFAAEGYCNCTCGGKWGSKYSWHLDQDNLSIVEKAMDILNKYYKDTNVYFEVIDVRESGSVYRVYAKGDVVRIVEEFRRMFYTNDEYGYKKVPSIILNADVECCAEFIKGYLMGDAYRDFVSYKKDGYWTFTTNSLTLYKGLEYMLMRMKSRIVGFEVDERKVIKRDGKDYICKDRKTAYNGIMKYISDDDKGKENVIKSITEFSIKDEYVYDLTTDDSTFVCGIGNILHHNTDSSYIQVIGEILNRDIVVRCVNEVIDKVNSELEKPIELAFEEYIRRLLVIAKKRYTMIIEDEKGRRSIVNKGIESVRRDWCDYSSDCMDNVIEILLGDEDVANGIKKSIQFVKDEASRLIDGGVELDKLVLSKKLSKPITGDYKAVHVFVAKKMIARGKSVEIGDRVSYIITNNGKRLISEKAEEVELVKEGKFKVDYDYYIQHQLLPPVMRVFDVIGVKDKSILVDRRQRSLFDF